MNNRKTPREVEFVLKNRFPVFIVLVLLTAVLIFQIKNLKLTADPLASLYPQGHPYLSTLRSIQEMTPERRSVVCVLTVNPGDIYTADTLKKIDGITKGLMEISGVSPTGITSLTKGITHFYNSEKGLSIESVLGAKWPDTPEAFADLKRRIAVNPKGLGRYIAYDSTATMITAELADTQHLAQVSYDKLPEKGRPPFTLYKSKFEKSLNANLLKSLNDLKARSDDPRHSLEFMGAEILAAQMEQMGARHIPVAAAGMFILIFLVLALYFRSFSGIVLPILASLISIFWVLGGFALFRIELNPMAILFPVILFLISVALSAMILQIYQSLFLNLKDKNVAISEAYAHIPVRGAVIGLGLITSILYFTSVPLLKDLGVMGLFWVAGAYISLMLLVPLFISFWPAPSVKTFKSPALPYFKPFYQTRMRSGIIFLLLIVLLSGAFTYPKLQVGDNIPGASYIRPDHPWNRCLNILTEKFMGPNQFLVYAKAKAQGGVAEPDVIRAISDFSNHLVHWGGARDSIAIDMMIKLVRWAFMDGNPKWQTLPISKSEIEGLAGSVMAQGGVEEFIDKTMTQAVISPFFPHRDAENIDAYANMIEAYISSHPSDAVEFTIGGGLLGMVKILNDGVRESYPLVLAVSVFFVFITGTIVTASFRKGLWSVLPIAAALEVIWMIMALTDLPISLPLVSVATVSVGFGFIFNHVLLLSCSPAQEAMMQWKSLIRMSGLILISCLPWFFIGMKFQATMMTAFGGMVLAQIITGLLFIPALACAKETE